MADQEKRQADALERIADLLENINKQLQHIPGQKKPPDRPKPQKKKTPAQLEAEFYRNQEG